MDAGGGGKRGATWGIYVDGVLAHLVESIVVCAVNHKYDRVCS